MLLVIGIFIAVIFLGLLIYLLIDNRIERKSFTDVLSVAGRLIVKCEKLLNALKVTLELCKELEKENATLRSILDDPDEFLRKQEEDGNI